MDIVRVETTKQNTVTRSNKFIKAQLQVPNGAVYGLMEKRFLLWVISCIEPQDQELRRYELPLDEFAELAKIPRQNIYQMVKKICRNVMALTWETSELDSRGKETATMLSIVYKAVHKEGEGTTEVTIHEDMAPYLLQQKKNFTSIKLVDFMPLRSKHALSLYEEIKVEQWKSKPHIVLVSDLRGIFSLSDGQYSEFFNFEARVLKPAVAEINNKTDIIVDYQKLKKGRRIHAIQFVVEQKKAATKALPSPTQDSTEVEGLIFYGVSEQKARKLVSQHVGKVKEALDAIKKQGGSLNNPAGWLVKYIEEGWVDGQKQHAKKKKEKSEADARQQAIREQHERKKQERSKAYMRQQEEQIKDVVSGWSAEEEQRYWDACTEQAKGGLLPFRFSKKKGLDKWLTMMHRQPVREYLTLAHGQKIMSESEFLDSLPD